MDALSEWANLFTRWFHVIAGISWIGQTYLFNWMEKTFEPPKENEPNVSGELWMVHGGGFYFVRKLKKPQVFPRTLHWFKWESMLTWLSGVALLAVVYYSGGLMVEPESAVGEGAAVALSLGLVLLAWPAYDLLWRLPAFQKSEPLGAAVCFGLILATAHGLTLVFSPRAAFFHVGAMLGTVMAANVWLRILPGQTRMLAAVKAGLPPDMSEGARAKRCSKHNTYMSVPLVLIMLSNHFPVATYGSERGVATLGAMILLGWAAAKLMRDGVRL